MSKRWVFDIETDGFLHECTRLWLVVFENIDTGQMLSFLPGDMGWKSVMDDAELLIGHNVLGYDFPALTKLTGYRLPKSVKVHDTLTMSQVLDYRRFGHDGHSLARWGEYFGFPKIDFDDFSAFSDEMHVYCIRDVNLNTKVYLDLRHELAELKERAPLVPMYMRVEQAATKFAAEASLQGWPFDIEKAASLLGDLQTQMDKAYVALSARLGMKAVPKDKKGGIVEEKRPKWVKAGCYDSHTANWFGVDPWSGFEGEERPIEGPFCRVTFEALSLDSVTDVKIFLFRNGWIPLEWNMKMNEATRRKEKTSPKITEDSLEFLGGDGKLYLDFLTAKSRLGVLKTWIANTDADGNLHGDCMVIGTPSMRARHSIIVNVPSGDSAWGPEMRALFKTKPGWSLIGCDSSGNQARGLAHYLGDETFIDTLLNGDIHQYNADILTDIVQNVLKMDYVVKRPQAKRILYAFLFGASGAKLWSYIFGAPNQEKGNKLKNGFIKAVPGFEDLLKKLNNIYGSTSKLGFGYIPGIAGNRIYVDSPHKLLVYLLQACEKATCSAALMLTMEGLEEAGIPYQPCIFMHDEEQFMVPDEFAEQAAAIGKRAFKDGPLLFNVTIMDGDAKVGKSWHDTH
jgi:DNA polymerase-1